MVSSPKELRGAYILITIQFDFPDRRIGDLQQLNKILQAMELTDLDLKNTEGYFALVIDLQNTVVNWHYGLERGTLHCELADGRPGHHYQIDSYVPDDVTDHDAYLDNWQKEHPDRVMHLYFYSKSSNMIAYTIVHHEKAAESHE